MTVQIPSGTNWVNNLDSQREFDKKITPQRDFEQKITSQREFDKKNT